MMLMHNNNKNHIKDNYNYNDNNDPYCKIRNVRIRILILSSSAILNASPTRMDK